MTTVAIIDYGRGNVRSVSNAVEYAGADAVITHDPAAIDDASHILLPGVGAFGDAVGELNARGLPEVLHRQVFEKGKPFLGICAGMQMLAATGLEHGEHAGMDGSTPRCAAWTPAPIASKSPIWAGTR